MSHIDYPLTDHDTIIERLTYLTNNENDVTHLNLAGANINDRIAIVLAKFLASEKCVVTDLNLMNNSLASLEFATCIANTIANNRSIVNLNLADNAVWMDVYTCTANLEEFVIHLAKAIVDHPCIKTIDLSNNSLHKSMAAFAIHKPKSLKHLNLTGNRYMDRTNLGYLFENCKLTSINLSRMEIGYIFSSIESSIVANRSLLKVDYEFYPSVCSVQKNEEVKSNIELMLLLNRKAHRAAINAALCLIAIRKFRVNECGLLGLVPKELVLMMARLVQASYRDDEWRLAVASPNKKIRL